MHARGRKKGAVASTCMLGRAASQSRRRVRAHLSRRASELRGHQRSSEVIRGHQRSSEVSRGQQRSAEVSRGHQRSSEVIRGHQWSSVVISGHQRSSGEFALTWAALAVQVSSSTSRNTVMRRTRSASSAALAWRWRACRSSTRALSHASCSETRRSRSASIASIAHLMREAIACTQRMQV